MWTARARTDLVRALRFSRHPVAPERYCDHLIPSFRMRDRKVWGLIPSALAAPNGPSMRPCERRRASWMWFTIAASSVGPGAENGVMGGAGAATGIIG